MYDILRELEEIETIKLAIKNRAMVYQAETKEQVARFYKLPDDTFYFASFDQWGSIWAKYRRENI